MAQYFGDDTDELVLRTAGIDFYSGAGGNDTLEGDDRDDLLYGGAGIDMLAGSSGQHL